MRLFGAEQLLDEIAEILGSGGSLPEHLMLGDTRVWLHHGLDVDLADFADHRDSTEYMGDPLPAGEVAVIVDYVYSFNDGCVKAYMMLDGSTIASSHMRDDVWEVLGRELPEQMEAWKELQQMEEAS